MPSPEVRRFSPAPKPVWTGMSKEFGPLIPEGPALALTKVHVALQEKTTELEFLQATFERAQASWVQEKGEMEDQIRELRTNQAQLERDVRARKAQNDEQGQMAKLAKQSWESEKDMMGKTYDFDVNELKSNLQALRSEVQVLENRNRQLRSDLQMHAGSVSPEQFAHSAQAAEARVRELEHRASAEIQAVWQDRANLIHQNKEMQSKVQELAAQLEEERKIREAHLSHSEVLVGDKTRMSANLRESRSTNVNLESALRSSQRSAASGDQPKAARRASTPSPAKSSSKTPSGSARKSRPGSHRKPASPLSDWNPY